MAEHTAGPWRSLSPHAAPDGTVTGWIVGAEPDEDAPTVAWIEEVEPADLRLMVAAPELLAALTALADYVEDDNPGAASGDAHVLWLCEASRAAIEKARGAIS